MLLDEATFRLAVDPEIESVAGDWHDLQLEKRDGEWKITGDECDMAGYYAQQYKVYKAKCGQEDILSINEYVLEQFRNEVIAGLEAAGFGKKRLTMQEKDYIIAKVKAEAPLLTRRQVRQAR